MAPKQRFALLVQICDKHSHKRQFGKSWVNISNPRPAIRSLIVVPHYDDFCCQWRRSLLPSDGFRQNCAWGSNAHCKFCNEQHLHIIPPITISHLSPLDFVTVYHNFPDKLVRPLAVACGRGVVLMWLLPCVCNQPNIGQFMLVQKWAKC